MLVILSPAKTLDYKTPPHIKEFTEPQLLDNSKKLIKRLREFSPPEISELMGISDKLGDLNFGRYLAWKAPFTPENAKQAVLAFKGDVYTGLDADSLDKQSLKWAQKHVRILSGLYGVLRPLDLMQPYRLEMGTRLQTKQGNDLYQFWGNTITNSLNEALKKDRPPVLVNLASNEYFKSVNTAEIKAEIITPVFKDWKGGKYKIISFFAKKARGLMTRYIIENRLTDVEGLKDFDVAGYSYNPAMSEAREWAFTRKESTRKEGQ